MRPIKQEIQDDLIKIAERCKEKKEVHIAFIKAFKNGNSHGAWRKLVKQSKETHCTPTGYYPNITMKPWLFIFKDDSCLYRYEFGKFMFYNDIFDLYKYDVTIEHTMNGHPSFPIFLWNPQT
jgi:hypothetical protein